MKQCNKCNVEKELTEFHKDSAAKDGRRNMCKICKASYDKQFFEENREKCLNWSSTWKANNKDRCLERSLKWYREHPEIMKEIGKRYYSNHIEERRAYSLEYRSKNLEVLRRNDREYYYNNKHVRFAANARRRARSEQATPSWADLEAIKEIYKRREEISLATGILHHVDHIIPLRGKNVSGLHVEYNLRIIPAEDNLRKHARFDNE